MAVNKQLNQGVYSNKYFSMNMVLPLNPFKFYKGITSIDIKLLNSY